MSRSCVCDRLSEHPREWDCVTRLLPSLFRLPSFQPQLSVSSSQNQLSVASSQVSAKPRVGGTAVNSKSLDSSLRPSLGMTDLGQRTSEEQNNVTSKSLFRNILSITPMGSIFCEQSVLVAFCFQYFADGAGEGGPPSLV